MDSYLYYCNLDPPGPRCPNRRAMVVPSPLPVRLASRASSLVKPLVQIRGRSPSLVLGLLVSLGAAAAFSGCDDTQQVSPAGAGGRAGAGGTAGAAGRAAGGNPPSQATLRAACEARSADASTRPDGFEIDDRLPVWAIRDGEGASSMTGAHRGSCDDPPRLEILRVDAAFCGPCGIAADALATALDPVASLFGPAAAPSTDGVASVDLLTIVYADEEGAPALAPALTKYRTRHPSLPGGLAFADPAPEGSPPPIHAAVAHRHVLPVWFLVDGRTGVILESLDNPSPDRIAPAIADAYEALTGIATEVPPPSAAKVDGRFRADEWALLQGMRLPKELPKSPSNAHADDLAASTLGASLFHDTALSGDSGFACVSCHRMDKFLADGLPVAVAKGTGTRNTPSVAFSALSRYQFWDGRADSLWSQALGPMENPIEMAGSRLAVVARIDAAHRDAYIAAFGPLPTFTATLPKSGRPGEPAYDGLPEADRAAVDRVFVNAGKAIEAFERSVAKNQPPSRFDRYLDGDKTALTDEELDGAALFLSAGCATCHHGPALSDGGFHNILMPSQDAPADRGRIDGVPALLASPFRADGPFSDDPTGAPTLEPLVADHALIGQQKTPSLRNVTKTAPYGHAGTFDTIGEVLAHYGKPRTAPIPGGLTVGEMDPAVGLFATPHAKRIEAFLATLSSP